MSHGQLFVGSDKQVVARQDAEMDICSSRMLGMKLEWVGSSRWLMWPFATVWSVGPSFRQTSDKDNVNRTEKSKQAVPSHPVVHQIFMEYYPVVILAITARSSNKNSIN